MHSTDEAPDVPPGEEAELTVSEEMGCDQCFSCGGSHGHAIRWLKEVEGLSLCVAVASAFHQGQTSSILGSCLIFDPCLALDRSGRHAAPNVRCYNLLKRGERLGASSVARHR